MTSDPKPISDDLLSRWERVAWRDSANNRTTIILPSTLLEMIARINASEWSTAEGKAVKDTAKAYIESALHHLKEAIDGLHEGSQGLFEARVRIAFDVLDAAKKELIHGL